jgi:hypothetical protein
MGTLLSRLKFPGSKGREPYITLTMRGGSRLVIYHGKNGFDRTAQVTVNSVGN